METKNDINSLKKIIQERDNEINYLRKIMGEDNEYNSKIIQKLRSKLFDKHDREYSKFVNKENEEKLRKLTNQYSLLKDAFDDLKHHFQIYHKILIDDEGSDYSSDSD
jgi:flagellar biosynthesis chaperone FliJ